MYLFTNFFLFILIGWMIFFVSLPIYISVSKESSEYYSFSAPKKTYIVSTILTTAAISMTIMIFLIIIKFDLGTIFKQ